MRRLHRRLAAIAAAFLLFVFLLVFLALPPAPIRLDQTGWSDLRARTVSGAYHIHSTRSDGAGDRNAIAAAARRAGLQFVILTDHGDGTRPSDPPIYLDGVLCLDAVEISSDEGHYVALDMTRSPYPLGGSAAAVVEDVRRLGGFGIAAHPDSWKPELRWTDTQAPIDGIEWLNADSEWRNESRGSLIRAGGGYVLRPGPALATLLDRPATLDTWDRLTARRPVVGIAGIDAHGGVGRRQEDGRLSGVLGIPSYEASFRTFSVRLILDRPLSGDERSDASEVFRAIRAGHIYTTIEAVAAGGLLDFRALTATGSVTMGTRIDPVTDATLIAHVLKPAGAHVVLLRDGRELASSSGELRHHVSAARGAYRVEVRVPGSPGEPPVPWLVSNPIYFLNPYVPAEPTTPTTAPDANLISIPAGGWRIEKDPGSSAVVRTRRDEVELEYALRPGGRADQYVAVATDISQPFSAVRTTLAADRPTRVSLQLRDSAGVRWGSSFYVSDQPRTVSVPREGFRGIGATTPRHVDSSRITSFLLVIDLTNAAPGRSGVLHILDSALVR